MNKILVFAAAILASFAIYKFLSLKNTSKNSEYAFDATKKLNLNSSSTGRVKNAVQFDAKPKDDPTSKAANSSVNTATIGSLTAGPMAAKNIEPMLPRSLATIKDVAGANALLDSIKTKEQAMQFLNDARLQNPETIRTAEPMTQMPKEIDQMRGTLEGKLAWDERPDAAVDINMNFNPQEMDGLVRGDLDINLSLNGMSLEDRKFIPILATMAGQGQIPDATVLSLSPRRYIQMFQVQSLNQWIGNYYMRNPITGNLSYVGTVRIDIPIK